MYILMSLSVADVQETGEGLQQLQSILSVLPRAVIVVMRYLFAFLNQYVLCQLLLFIIYYYYSL